LLVERPLARKAFELLRSEGDEIVGNTQIERSTDIVVALHLRKVRIANDDQVEVAIRADVASRVRAENECPTDPGITTEPSA
jgi:hypothetical protein